MTVNQPIVKTHRAFDWLCWVLVIFASLCLAASVPQTFTMVRVAHDDWGSSILVVVLEVMAFFALLAPLWVPAWTKTFDRIAYTLLGITTLGNYAGGWNFVWTNKELAPFWAGIIYWRDPVLDLPLATILLVGVLSGLVPFAMKFFVFLAIKRYRENEIEHTPEAVAARMVEPFQVQILATKLMNQHLLGLTGQVDAPLVMRNVEPARQLMGQSDQLLALQNELNRLRDEGNAQSLDWNAEVERLEAENRLLRDAAKPTPTLLNSLLDAGVQPDKITVETEQPATVVRVKEAKVWTLEMLLADLGKTYDELRSAVKRYTDGTAAGAYQKLKNFGMLPKGLSKSEFERLFRELMDEEKIAPPEQTPGEAVIAALVDSAVNAQAAVVDAAIMAGPCTHAVSNSDKSVCAKPYWKTRLGGAVMCKECRELRR
jgi:hypothetical protein